MCVRVRGRRKVRKVRKVGEQRGGCRGTFRSARPGEAERRPCMNLQMGQGAGAEAELCPEGGNGDAEGRAEADGAGKGMV